MCVKKAIIYSTFGIANLCYTVSMSMLIHQYSSDYLGKVSLS